MLWYRWVYCVHLCLRQSASCDFLVGLDWWHQTVCFQYKCWKHSCKRLNHLVHYGCLCRQYDFEFQSLMFFQAVHFLHQFAEEFHLTRLWFLKCLSCLSLRHCKYSHFCGGFQAKTKFLVFFKLWRCFLPCILVQTHILQIYALLYIGNWLSQIHSLFNTWQVGYQITSKRSLPWVCGMGPPGDSLLWGRLTIACWLEPLSISESQCKDTKSVRRQLTVAHTCSQLLILFHRFSLLWCL